MRTDPLDGARLKLKRAWSQIRELESDVRAYLATEPYQPKIHFDKSSQTLTVTLVESRAPDPLWGVRVGEIVHDLRSPLDQLVWYLAGRPDPKTARTQFPIADSSEAFEAAARTQLHGVNATVVALIRSEQPFNRGTVLLDPLRHLREISNADKHRTIQMTAAGLSYSEFKFPPLSMTVQKVEIQKYEGGPIQDGTVIWRGRLLGATGWPFSSNETHAEFHIDVHFERDVPAPGDWSVFGTIAEIGNRVEQLVVRIAREVLGSEL